MIASITPGSIFQGYDSVFANARNTAVTGSTSSSVPADQDTSLIHVCIGYSDAASSLEIDVSASVGVAGIGGADAKYRYFQSLHITKTSLTIFARVKHIDSVIQINSPSLSDEAKTMVTPINGFVNRFGDSYVSSITYGAEYIAAYVFHTETIEEATNIQASLKANGIFDGISASTDFSTAIESVSKSSSARMSYSQTMTGINGSSTPAAQDIQTFVKNFPVLAKGSKAVLSWSLSYYERDFPELENSMEPVVANRQYFRGIPGVTSGKLDEYAILLATKAQIDEISQIYKFYQPTYSDDQLKSNLKSVSNDIKSVQDQLANYYNHPERPLDDISLDSLNLGSPTLSLAFTTKSAANGNNGQFHNEITDLSGFIRKLGKISKIELKGDLTINGIVTTYTIGGLSVAEGVGDAGNYQTNLDLSGNEYYSISSFHASEWASQLKSLTIYSTRGSVSMGHVDNRAEYTITPDPGQFLVTIASRWWGSEVVQVVFNYAAFQPAQWG